MSATLRVRPVTITEARAFVSKHHRHNLPPGPGAQFCVGIESDSGELVGVAIAGRPVARALCDGETLEVWRTCTVGVENGNSMLYGAICRAAKALGFRRVITYTLQEESGVSLKASGFRPEAHLAARPSWDTPSRPRVQTDLFGEARRPPGPKVRWVRDLRPAHPVVYDRLRALGDQEAKENQ
jgi:hypothetical protein